MKTAMNGFGKRADTFSSVGSFASAVLSTVFISQLFRVTNKKKYLDSYFEGFIETMLNVSKIVNCANSSSCADYLN